MESTRQNKVARQLQKDLSEILQNFDSSVLKGKMVTVTMVRMSPDLSVAKIYLSIFPSPGKEQLLESIKQHSKQIRNQLGQKVRNQLRVVPELAFNIDDSMDYAERIDQLLK